MTEATPPIMVRGSAILDHAASLRLGVMNEKWKKSEADTKAVLTPKLINDISHLIIQKVHTELEADHESLSI